MSIPFTTFDGYLKSIRFDALEPNQQVAMRFAFGEFFSDEQRNTAAIAKVNHIFEYLKAKAGFKRREQEPYRYRRYSGGKSLPRARYYSVATDEGGLDGQTLLQEVRSYADHSKSGRLIVFDSSDAEAARDASRTFRLRDFTVPDRSLVMVFFDDENYPSPVVRQLMSAGVLDRAGNHVVAASYRVERKQIAKVIDLRCPSTQRWLYEILTHGLPGVTYYYGGNLAHGLVLQGPRNERLHGDPGTGLNHGGTKTAVWYPPRAEWNGDLRDGPADFFGLLPFLIYPGRGGSPVTEAIGRHLRRIGANGFVYPSVRTDVFCKCRGDQVQEFAGWNFVDYRDAPPPDEAAWIVVAPDSWWGLIGAYTDVRRSPDGWWSVVGNARGTLEWFVRQQQDRARAVSDSH